MDEEIETGGVADREAWSEADFADIVDAAAELVDLDHPAQAEIWVSGLFGLWRDPGAPDPESVDRAFFHYLARHRGPVARAIVAAARALGAPSIAATAAELANEYRRRDDVIGPVWADQVGTATPTAAWEVRRPSADGVSVVVGYEHGDGSAHSLMAELVDGVLVDLVFGPGPDQLMTLDAQADLVVRRISVDRAQRRIVDGWHRLNASSPADLGDRLVANHLIVAARLGVDPRLPTVAEPEVGQLDENKRREFDASALSTLQAALRRELAGDPPPELESGMADAVAAAARLVGGPGPFDATRRERRALAQLEWADWLGAVIELVRDGPGAEVTPGQLVDHINRCPEVTTTIPKSDRDWFSWVWSLAIDQWRAIGLVSDDGLTELGWWVLPRALVVAWSPERRFR